MLEKIKYLGKKLIYGERASSKDYVNYLAKCGVKVGGGYSYL